jgi:hypothetical protein
MEITTRTRHYENLSLSNLREYINGVGWVIEKWKDIIGYEGSYAVSDFGRVWSYSRLVWQPQRSQYVKRKERILKQKKCSDGYLAVTLQVDSIRKYVGVHRLVALMFVKNPKNKPEVNHVFGDKKQNRPNMLEWVTDKENTQHAIKLGLAPSQVGETNNRSKLKESDVIEIRHKHKNGTSGVDLAKEYKVYPTAVNKIIHKKTWRHIA